MGMYTELIFGAQLKKETPKEVIETLQYMLGDIEKPKKLLFDVEKYLLRKSSFYFGVNKAVNKMWFDDITCCWHISTRNNFKNYENQIELFLEWIKPWIEQGSGEWNIYAYVLYEEDIVPELYYLEDIKEYKCYCEIKKKLKL